jgi:hypothetical protein
VVCNSKIKSIKKLLASWTRRDLTPISTITVIKKLALPKLIHLFSALPDPTKQLVDEINKIFFKFILGYKVEGLKRNANVCNYDEGRLNIIHLPSFTFYIKLKWVSRYLSDNTGTWLNMLHNTLNMKCVDFVFTCPKKNYVNLYIKLTKYSGKMCLELKGAAPRFPSEDTERLLSEI